MSAPISIQPQKDQIVVSGDVSIRELPANQFEINRFSFDEITAQRIVDSKILVTIRNIRTPKQYEDFIPRLMALNQVRESEAISILGIRTELEKIIADYTDLQLEQLSEFSIIELKDVIESFMNSKLITALTNSFSGADEKKAPEKV